jgi:hypothetical protein
MRAAVLRGAGSRATEEWPRPAIGPGAGVVPVQRREALTVCVTP